MDMTRLIQKFLLGHILFIYPTRRKRSSSVVSYNEQFTRSVISLYCISTTNCFSKRCINIAFLLTAPYYISNSFNVLTKKTECFCRITAMPENAQNRNNLFVILSLHLQLMLRKKKLNPDIFIAIIISCLYKVLSLLTQ